MPIRTRAATMPSTLRDLGRLAAAGPGAALDAATYAAFAAGARLALAVAQAAAARNWRSLGAGRQLEGGLICAAPASRAGSTFDLARQIPSRSHAVPMLQLFALTVMVIPSDTVIKAIGAGGYPPRLVGHVRVRRFRRRDRARASTTRCDTDTRFGACSACSG